MGGKVKAVSAIFLLLVSVLLVASRATAESTSGSKTGSTRPTVGIVVAVDESGSLTSQDLDAEKRAAAAVLNLPYSSIEISAFGGLVGFSNDAHPICPDAADRPLPALPLTDTAACVDQLTSGGDTNHAAAIRTATAMLDTQNTRDADSKIVILMTDGKCDPTGRGGCDEDEVSAAVAAAKASRVQIWPVAFGEIDRTRMGQYANGGAGPNRRCPKAVSPKLIETNDPAALGLALLDVVRQSSCGVGVLSGRDSLRIPVSPLLNKLVLQVTDPDGPPADPVIHDESGATKTCEGRATPSPNVVTCTFVNPSPAGSWDATDKGSLIVALQQGAVALRVEGCDAALPVPDQPKVIADAGREVDWSLVGPEELMVTLAASGGSGVASTLVRPDQSSGVWQSSAMADGAGSAGTLTPAGASASLPWLTVSGEPCEYRGTAAAPVVETKPGGFPWALVILLALVLLALIIVMLVRRRRRRLLPNATIFLRNSFGAESIPTFVPGGRRWDWDIDWSVPTLTPMMATSNTTVVREGSSGLLRFTTIGGDEPLSVEFDTDFRVVVNGVEVGTVRIEKQSLALEDEVMAGGLFGDGPSGSGASSNLFG